MKTLAIRLDDDVHAQLSIVAQLRNSTITEEIRVAIEGHLVSARTDPSLSAQAEDVLKDIDAEALKRRDAIGQLFAPGAARPAPATKSRRGHPTTPTAT